MDKISLILAIVENSETGAVVLDKAVALGLALGARVELLVADSLLTKEFASRCAALAYEGVTVGSLYRSGEPLHTQLLRRIGSRLPDLVIKAPAGAHPLRSWVLHENDRALARESPVPVLLAGPRPWNTPPILAAAVDVSDPDAALATRGILQAAGFFALGLQSRLDVLYSEREERDETVRMERAVKLAQLVREFHVGSERLQMFGGAPENRLPPLIAARKYDILVLGAETHRDGVVFQTLTHKLADATEGDVLLVPPAGAARERAGTARPSARYQVPDNCEQFV